MSAFGGMVLTNRGRNLQAKAQAGVELHFNRIAVGDGQLGSSSIVDLNALKNEIKSLNISKLKALSGGKAVVGTVLSNQDIITGFYFREIGVFAQDPDVGEILYCYANCGATAEYIPAGGGPDIIEKSIDLISIVGAASNVTATIEQSLIYASAQQLNDHENDTDAHGLSGRISHSLATAVNDFLVASAAGQFVKKTLAEIKTILGLGSAAYKDTGVAGGVALHDDVETHKADNVAHITSAERNNWNGIGLNSYASVVDANGIYTVVEYKRSDGTLYMKSTLSGGTSPSYTTDIWQFYDALGTTVIVTKTWTISYDANGKITSKVVA